MRRPSTIRVPAVTALLVGVAALVGGQGLLNTTVSLALEGQDVRGALLAVVLGAYYLGWILGCLRTPALIRRVGHIRTFATLCGSGCAVTLAYALSSSPYVWILLRVASGFCLAGLLLTVENWLTLHASPQRRGVVLSAYLIIFHLGLGGGQFLLLQTGVLGTLPFIVSALFLALASVPVAATRSEAPSLPQADFLGLRELTSRARTALAAALISGIINGAYQTLAPVYLGRLGFSAGDTGLWMGVAVISGLALQFPIGLLSDRSDRRVLLALVALALAGTSFGLTRVDGGLAPLLLLGAAFGSLAALVYPLALAHGNDRVPADASLGLGSTLVMVAGVGSLMGPILGSAGMTWTGPEGLFLCCGVAAAVLAMLCLSRVVSRRAPSSAQSEPYVAAPDTTLGAVQLDPRVPNAELEEPRPPVPEPGR